MPENSLKTLSETRRVINRNNSKVSPGIADAGGIMKMPNPLPLPFTITHITGRILSSRQPVVLGALEAARHKGFITYEVIQTAEGMILDFFKGRAEDNEHGSGGVRLRA